MSISTHVLDATRGRPAAGLEAGPQPAGRRPVARAGPAPHRRGRAGRRPGSRLHGGRAPDRLPDRGLPQGPVPGRGDVLPGSGDHLPGHRPGRAPSRAAAAQPLRLLDLPRLVSRRQGSVEPAPRASAVSLTALTAGRDTPVGKGGCVTAPVAIEDCYVATVDPAGREYPSGHVVMDQGRIAAAGPGRCRRSSPGPPGSTAPGGWSRPGWSTPTRTCTSGSPAATRPTPPCSAGWRRCTRSGPG